MDRLRSTCGRLLLGAALLTVPLGALAGTDVRVMTLEGETLRGQWEAEALEIDVRMGRRIDRKRVPVGDVLSTDLRKTKLRDGGVLRGKVLLESLALVTAAGRVVLDAARISSIEAVPAKAAAAAPKPNPVKPVGPRGTVILSDGSQLMAEFLGESLSAESTSGAVQIQWSEIAETDLRQVRMRDGDALKVRVTEKVKVKTRFGPLELTPENTKSIQIKGVPNSFWRGLGGNKRAQDGALQPDGSMSEAGKIALGLNLDLVNLGPGPTLVYGVTDRLYAQASIGGIGGPFGLEMKGGYRFASGWISPYGGFGLRNVTKDEDAEYYSGVAPKGTSGFLFGGLRAALYEELFGNKYSEYLEFGYSIFHEKQTVAPGGYVEPNPIKWHVAAGMVYRFDRDLRLPFLEN
ncbi:MAG: hypothetical protein FD126_1437 [Elusimicrobia bacterium]|nr:MAG: hypothetical protein FD126_1437 [Elusimicrobiota bacterium]